MCVCVIGRDIVKRVLAAETVYLRVTAQSILILDLYVLVLCNASEEHLLFNE